MLLLLIVIERVREMNSRTPLYTLLSVLFAVSVLACATAFQTGYKAAPSEWLHAHLNSPSLWITDICVVFALIWMSSYARADGLVRLQAAELRRLQEEYQKQLEQMISATDEMDSQNSEYSDRILDLEKESVEKEIVFEREARRLTEQTFHALQGQVDANTRQMEAVNMAMQYQRAGLQQLGGEVKGLSLGTEHALPMLPTAHPESAIAQLESGDKDPEWNEFLPDEAVVNISEASEQVPSSYNSAII